MNRLEHQVELLEQGEKAMWRFETMSHKAKELAVESPDLVNIYLVENKMVISGAKILCSKKSDIKIEDSIRMLLKTNTDNVSVSGLETMLLKASKL